MKIRAPFSVAQAANSCWLIRDAAGRKVQTIRPRDRWGEISLICPEWRDITKIFAHVETTKLIEVKTRKLREKEKARRDPHRAAQPAPDRAQKEKTNP